MNKTAIKNYAVWARKELIERVTIKAFEYEVIKDGTLNSNLDIINGKPLTNNEKKQREQLIKGIFIFRILSLVEVFHLFYNFSFASSFLSFVQIFLTND